jgi:hypothetical protein
MKLLLECFNAKLGIENTVKMGAYVEKVAIRVEKAVSFSTLKRKIHNCCWTSPDGKTGIFTGNK